MGHVLWLVPDTIITARLSLPIKGDRGRKNTEEGDPTTAPTVLSPRVQLFPFVFLLPLNRPKNTPASNSLSFSSIAHHFFFLRHFPSASLPLQPVPAFSSSLKPAPFSCSFPPRHNKPSQSVIRRTTAVEGRQTSTVASLFSFFFLSIVSSSKKPRPATPLCPLVFFFFQQQPKQQLLPTAPAESLPSPLQKSAPSSSTAAPPAKQPDQHRPISCTPGNSSSPSLFAFLAFIYFFISCMQNEQHSACRKWGGKLIPPPLSVIVVGPEDSGPCCCVFWARLILAHPCCLGQVRPR